MPVKRGFPQQNEGIEGLTEALSSPRFATAVGLLKYGMRNKDKAKFTRQEKRIYTRIKDSMGVWIKDLF
jgi:cell division ATPase FtsA